MQRMKFLTIQKNKGRIIWLFIEKSVSLRGNSCKTYKNVFVIKIYEDKGFIGSSDDAVWCFSC